MTQERGPLSSEQFDAVASWDQRQAEAWGGLDIPEPAEHMPIEEARRYVDPVFSPWSKFHAQEKGYIAGLAEHVKARGVQVPIRIQHSRDQDPHKIYDGHHRLAAAEVAGLKTVPVVFYDRRGDRTTKQPPHSFPLKD
jgi:hypothetical protein